MMWDGWCLERSVGAETARRKESQHRLWGEIRRGRKEVVLGDVPVRGADMGQHVKSDEIYMEPPRSGKAFGVMNTGIWLPVSQHVVKSTIEQRENSRHLFAIEI